MKRIALAASLLLAAAAIAGVARPEGAHAVDGQAQTRRLDHRLGQRLGARACRRPRSLSLGVDVRAATAKAALAANAREMRQVIDAVKAAGGRQVGTQSVSLSQVLGQNGEPNGFAASNVVSATVDVERAGAADRRRRRRRRQSGERARDVRRGRGEALPAGLEGGRCRCAPERRDTRRCGRTLARQGGLGRRERGLRRRCRCSRRPASERGTPIEAGTQQTTASVTVTFALG